MNETKRGNFPKEEIDIRLSRRRFAMATTGAAMMALGSRNAWAQAASCQRCVDTATVIKDLTMPQIFGGSGVGKTLTQIVSDAVVNFSGSKKVRLETLRDTLSAQTQPEIYYRDFFVTPGGTTFETALGKLTSTEEIALEIEASLRAASVYFQLPMLKLPLDHDPVLCKHVIDGWPTPPPATPPVEPKIAGVVHSFETDTLHSILNEAPDYTRADIPWRWRAHLLRLTNLLGMTKISNGVRTNYKCFYERQMTIANGGGGGIRSAAAGGANQCAYYTPTGGWACGSSPGDKCVLDDEGEPAEGTDLCNPPPG